MTPEPDPPSIPAARLPTRLRAKDLAGFAVGLVLFALVLRWLAPDWAELRAAARFDWRWALFGLLGTTLASFTTAARWRLLAEAMGGTKLPFVTYFHALVMTRVLGQFLPTMAVDLVGRGMALRSAGSKRGLGHAATQVVLERMFDAVLPVVVLAWALSVRADLLPAEVPLAASLAGFAGVFMLVAIPLLRPSVGVALRVYLWLKLRLPGARRKAVEAEAEAELAETPAVDAKLATQVAALSLARYATVVIQFWGIAGAIGLSISWSDMTAAASVAQLAGLLSLTPGGLGILEAGWAGALGWIGLGSAAIGLWVLGQRLGILGFFGLLTALSYPLAAQHKRARETAEASA